MPVLARALCLFGLLSMPAHADAVSDALQAAVTAYETGDLKGTSAHVAFAAKGVSARQSALLSALLPAAPDGWMRVDNADMAQGLAAIGGGAGAEASYTSPDGMTVTLSAYADNIMVQTFTGLLADPQVMAMMGKTIEINGVTFLVQEGSSTMALLENRVLLQANGEALRAQELLGQIDLAAMAMFDAKP